MQDVCLVTGGAGFIGSHLVEALTGLGCRVRILDNYNTGLKDNLSHLQPAPEFISGDVGNPDDVARAMVGVDVVFHLAALASVVISLENPGETHRVCATGTLNVLEAARRNGVRRVIYAGSASCYGIPGKPVQSEEDPLQPLSPYGAAKLAGELYCQSFTNSFGLETVRLRFFNIFGPRQRADSPYSGVIALFTRAFLAGQTPRIFGDGLQTRDFTYVGDVIQGLLKAASVPGISGQVFHVGTGRAVTLLDLVAGLNELLNIQIQPIFAPPRTGDIRHSCADIQKARHYLDYSPQTTFEQGLAQTLRWYQKLK